MLRISKLADYAVVIMHALAEADALSSTSELAEQTKLSTATVSKLLKLFVHAGLIASQRGAQGGYQLAKAPSEISLADVVSIVDGPIAMTDCNASDKQCQQAHHCGLKDNWQIINQVVEAALSNISIEAMARPLGGHPLAINGVSLRPVVNLTVKEATHDQQ